jgi:hypothetical protein
VFKRKKPGTVAGLLGSVLVGLVYGDAMLIEEVMFAAAPGEMVG